MEYAVFHPELLLVSDGDTVCRGGSQEWYTRFWQRLSGCGPTNASLLAWYLASSRPGCGVLADRPSGSRQEFKSLMDEMWRYVMPSGRGVNRPDMLSGGLIRYAAERGVRLTARALPVSEQEDARPTECEMSDFLTESFKSDRPVAFLNLHNGEERALDRWHWVTLVSFDGGSRRAVMYDQGRDTSIDLSLWLRTTELGGGFVTADCL